jgi:hypothetical protein
MQDSTKKPKITRVDTETRQNHNILIRPKKVITQFSAPQNYYTSSAKTQTTDYTKKKTKSNANVPLSSTK